MAVAMTASQAREPAGARVSARATFESPNPATGQPMATFLIHQRADADMAVSRAREAARWWGAPGWRERCSRLLDGGGVAPGRLLPAGSAPQAGSDEPPRFIGPVWWRPLITD